MIDISRRRRELGRPLIMGIVNVTPDSFSDGGQFYSPQAAIDQGLKLIDEGADLLDIGGESTRPGAATVSIGEEIARVRPVLHGLVGKGAAVSVDTQKPEVMRIAVEEGVDMINDVNAFLAEGAIETVADSSVHLCIMHKKGTPLTMQQAPEYGAVVDEVRTFLAGRLAALQDAGVRQDRIAVDPGFGFGKTLQHNLELLRHLDALRALNANILVGLSRKSMLGQITGRGVEERLAGSLAVAVYAAMKGADIIRVHDVKETRDALEVLKAIWGEE